MQSDVQLLHIGDELEDIFGKYAGVMSVVCYCVLRHRNLSFLRQSHRHQSVYIEELLTINLDVFLYHSVHLRQKLLKLVHHVRIFDLVHLDFERLDDACIL